MKAQKMRVYHKSLGVIKSYFFRFEKPYFIWFYKLLLMIPNDYDIPSFYFLPHPAPGVITPGGITMAIVFPQPPELVMR